MHAKGKLLDLKLLLLQLQGPSEKQPQRCTNEEMLQEHKSFNEGRLPNLQLSLSHDLAKGDKVSDHKSRGDINTMLSLSLSPTFLSQSSEKHNPNTHIKNWDLQTNSKKVKMGLST